MTLARAVRWAWAAASLGLAVGCSRTPGASLPVGAEVEGGGARFAESADLKPDADPGERSKLVISGTDIPIELDHGKKGDDVTLVLRRHDAVFETESYRSKLNSFQLTAAGEERYEPPIDLLRFPMRVGDSWPWKGSMVFGGRPKAATAQVTAFEDRVKVGEAEESAVKIEVALSIEANPPNGPIARRELGFWFVPGKGIVKRSFGAGSVREPRDEP